MMMAGIKYVEASNAFQQKKLSSIFLFVAHQSFFCSFSRVRERERVRESKREMAIQSEPEPTARERELAVGIRCFLSSSSSSSSRADSNASDSDAALGGVFKHRYTDFVVREVDLEGKVAKLERLIELNTNEADKTAAPGGGGGRGEAVKLEKSSRYEAALNGEKKAVVAAKKTWLSLVEDNNSGNSGNSSGLEALLTERDLGRVKAWLTSVAGAGAKESESEKEKEKVDRSLVLSPNDNKEERTRVHMFFKQRQDYVPLITTDTLIQTEEGRGRGSANPLKSVRLFAVGGEGKGRRGGGGDSWDSRKRKRENMDYRSYKEVHDRNGGSSKSSSKHCKFLLYKENVETQHALKLLTQHLRCNARRLGYAGTKDKRGVTTQWCTGFKINAKQLAQFNRVAARKKWGTIRVGNFEDLRGEDDKSLGLGDLLGNHFDIILRDVKAEKKAVAEQAIEALKQNGFINYYGLQRFGTGDYPTYKVGIELLKGNWKAACKMILQGRETERVEHKKARQCIINILEGVKAAGPKSESVERELKEASGMLPSNAVAEKCIVSGLLKNGMTNFVAALLSIPKTLKLMYIHSYQSFIWNHAASKRLELYSREHAVEGDLVLVDQNPRGGRPSDHMELPSVRKVTKEESEKHAISIDKVVLPLPGSEVTYPENSVSQVYQEFLSRDSLNPEEAAHKVRQFSMTSVAGAYRNLVQVPRDVGMEFIQYDHPDEDLVLTDFARLCKGNGKQNSAKTGAGKYNALKVKFTLNSSCYATMAVRELTKGTDRGRS